MTSQERPPGTVWRLAPLDLPTARVCEILDRWADRLTGHDRQARASERRSMRSMLIALVPRDNPDPSAEREWVAVRIASRNISTGGMSLIAKEQIIAEEIAICLGQDVTLRAAIVRRRRVHDGFWEYGVVFTGRSDAAESASAGNSE